MSIDWAKTDTKAKKDARAISAASAELETLQTPELMRKAILGDATAKAELRRIDDEIAALNA